MKKEIEAKIQYVSSILPTWPEHLDDYLKQCNLTQDEAFRQVEQDVTFIFQEFQKLDQTDQRELIPSLETFQKKIEEHHNRTKERLSELKQETEHSRRHANGIKAYNK